tara:strand:+ start:1308 stop:1424 length:117 start_codon:yes stop_codon:yes gene_type:complete
MFKNNLKKVKKVLDLYSKKAVYLGMNKGKKINKSKGNQ